jgi:hypothetical protein
LNNKTVTSHNLKENYSKRAITRRYGAKAAAAKCVPPPIKEELDCEDGSTFNNHNMPHIPIHRPDIHEVQEQNTPCLGPPPNMNDSLNYLKLNDSLES